MSLQLEYCLNLHAPMIAQVCMASYRGGAVQIEFMLI